MISSRQKGNKVKKEENMAVETKIEVKYEDWLH